MSRTQGGATANAAIERLTLRELRHRQPFPEVGATTASSRKADFASVFETEAAFCAWYDDAAPRVYAYLHGRCGGDTRLAEELTQQTFVSAIRGRAGFDGRSDSTTWIIAIARNRLAGHYRKQARDERRHLRVVVGEIAREAGPTEAAWREADTREDVLATLRARRVVAVVQHHLCR